MMSVKFFRGRPWLPCNEIWIKIGYNSGCMRDISEIFVSIRGFSGSGYWTMWVKFYHDRPWLPWQRNLS